MTQLMDAPAPAHGGNGNGGGLVRSKATVMGSLADRYQMDAGKLLETLKATCIKGQATNEQVQAFCIVANRYGLDPFLKEIHAFAGQGGAIVPIVGIDGWCKIANSRPEFDGCDFAFEGKGDDLSCTCTIYVKGRAHPVRVTEYLSECKRNTAPWTQFTRRMLRHKAFMQCVRLSFGLGGIYDEDEAKDIIGNEGGNPPNGKRPFGPQSTVIAHPTAEGQVIDTSDSNLPPTEEAERILADAPRAPRQQAPDAQTEVDVSGADAEPPTADVSTYELFYEAMQGVAQTADVEPKAFDAAMAALRVSHPLERKTHAGLEARQKVYAAAAGGKLDWGTGKVL